MSQPDNESQLDQELDPFWQEQEAVQNADIESSEIEDKVVPQEVPPQVEAEYKQTDTKPRFEKWSHNIPVLGPIKAGLDSAALGVGDFASDAIGLVPYLKPIDDWWDANSARSTSPAHKLIRDASSVILPSLMGGSWIVGGAKAMTAAKAITLPGYIKTLGSVAAYSGVDTGVAMISSHSKTDDNMAATLNNWLGWNIPWATRPGDDPDTRWKKNVMENAGLSAGVELLGAALTFGRKAKLFPRDAGAEQAINAKRAAPGTDALTQAIEPLRQARTAAQLDEALEAIAKDPDGLNYNAFVNDIGPDDAGRAVTNLEADPLQAKLHQAQIQQNIGTKNGSAAPVVSEKFNKEFAKAINGNERAKYLDQLFDSISPNFDAVVTTGANDVKITAEQMNRAVDNLTQNIFGKDVDFQQFQAIVEDMKTTVFNSNQILDEDAWESASQAFKNVYETVFDPNQVRASAMLTQQAADNIQEAATAAKMLGDNVDTTRQFELMFDKMNLLDNEVRINKYITSKAAEYKKIKSTQDIAIGVSWLNKVSREFDGYIKRVRESGESLRDELINISKEKPHYFNALKEAYYATEGDVDTLHKLHKWTEKNIGVLKNGFIDGDPEVPSMIVKGLHGVRMNSLLSGLSSARAAVGNSMLTAIKPISIFAGAAVRGDVGTLKRAWYTYTGFSENFKRAFKVMGQEWRLANQFPEEAMMRGRADMRLAQMNKLEALGAQIDALRTEGEHGKVAMINIARGMGWWNKQNFVRYGTNALYSIDGFTNSFMASGMARARAYDQLLSQSNGAIPYEEFLDTQRHLYSQAFDESGLLTDQAAKFASQEIALNLDNKVVQSLENFMDHVPAARPLFLFPRTGVNATELAWSFNPTSSLGPALTKARRALGAKTAQQKLDVLIEHGIDSTQNADLAFETLRSEYIGRQLMGGSVVMGVGLWALEGNVTGNGPQNAGERRRMMQMGWKPNSIKNPITGEWRSYKGFAPFDQVMGLVADVVYQAKRVDQSITEDWFRKIAHSISMNITNDTFIGGFEPLVSLISGDPSSWTRFWAGQIDMQIPYKGVRSVLNNIIHPQLNDVDNDITSYLMNANKFMFPGKRGMDNDPLAEMLDIYTGKPINYYDNFTHAINSVLPFFKSNGDTEPWRQWLLSTGWDGLQKIRVNRHTGLPLNTHDRQFLNNWIAKNAALKEQIITLMTENDGWWNKKIKEYAKARGLKTQKQFPIKQFVLHQELDYIHDLAFEGAWDALEAYNEQFTSIGREIQNRNHDLRRGDAQAASESQRRVQDLQRMTK